MNRIKFNVILVMSLLTMGVVFAESSKGATPGKTHDLVRDRFPESGSIERKFFAGVYERKKATAEFFLDVGLDVNTRDLGGKTALMIAAERGYIEIVKLLLSKGADKKAIFQGSSSKKALTAFDLAIAAGQKKTAELVK